MLETCQVGLLKAHVWEGREGGSAGTRLDHIMLVDNVGIERGRGGLRADFDRLFERGGGGRVEIVVGRGRTIERSRLYRRGNLHRRIVGHGRGIQDVDASEAETTQRAEVGR